MNKLEFDKFKDYLKNIKKSKNLVILFIYSDLYPYSCSKNNSENLLLKLCDLPIDFFKLNIEKHKEIENKFFLTGIPCFLLLRNNKLISIINGFNTNKIRKEILDVLNFNCIFKIN